MNMNPAADTDVYKAFGLTIASDIALPELLRETDQACDADVYIERADLSQLGISETAATIIMRSTATNSCST